MSIASLAEKLQAIRGPYLASLRLKFEVLEQLRAKLEKGHFTAEDHKELLMQAHKIAGTAKTYGFASLSDTARTLEEHLIDNSAPGNPEIHKHISNLIESCVAAMAA